MTHTRLVSANGSAIAPNIESFTNAQKGADWSSPFTPDLINCSDDGAWPITCITYALIDKNHGKQREVCSFFEWVWAHGAADLAALGFVPLPADVVKAVLGDMQ